MTREEAENLLDEFLYKHEIMEDYVRREDYIVWTQAAEDNAMSEYVQLREKLVGLICGAENEEREMDKWIPVSERLPKEGETVIASTEYSVYPEARYTEKYGWEWAYESGADYWKKIDPVLAWMPLPTKYEPEESEVSEDKE